MSRHIKVKNSVIFWKMRSVLRRNMEERACMHDGGDAKVRDILRPRVIGSNLVTRLGFNDCVPWCTPSKRNLTL